MTHLQNYFKMSAASVLNDSIVGSSTMFFFSFFDLWLLESEKRRQWLGSMLDVLAVRFRSAGEQVIDHLHNYARLGLNMYAFPPTTSHISSHSNLSTTHDSVNTTNNNHHHHHHSNNNSHHHHRDSSIDKESSLGESNIFASRQERESSMAERERERERGKANRKSSNQITFRLDRWVMIRRKSDGIY